MRPSITSNIRHMALVWWVRNLNRKNFGRAARWEAIAKRYEGGES